MARWSRFATEGLRVSRSNPDGTIPTAARFLGYAGPYEGMDDVLVDGAADLTVKIDETAETKTVDFGGIFDERLITLDAADDVEVTLDAADDELIILLSDPEAANILAALTAAGFTGITWSVDATTGLLKGASASGAYAQVTGALASALGFGQGAYDGLKILKFFNDEIISVGLAKKVRGRQAYEITGAKGSITSIIVGARLLGKEPVITLKIHDRELVQLVQGGTIDRTTGAYEPPIAEGVAVEMPQFWIEVFSPVFIQNTNRLGGQKGFERLLLRACYGREGDAPPLEKALARFTFHIDAIEYCDANGNRLPAYQEAVITTEEYEALNVRNV